MAALPPLHQRLHMHRFSLCQATHLDLGRAGGGWGTSMLQQERTLKRFTHGNKEGIARQESKYEGIACEQVMKVPWHALCQNGSLARDRSQPMLPFLQLATK